MIGRAPQDDNSLARLDGYAQAVQGDRPCTEARTPTGCESGVTIGIDDRAAFGKIGHVTRQPDEPNVDPRWDEAMELLLNGRSHNSVAAAVGCHRNTITNWLKDPTFRVELARRSDERLAAAKQRLAIVTTKLVDRLGQLAQQAMDAAEQDPTDRHARCAARDWLRNYRELCRVEAQILGLVVHPA